MDQNQFKCPECNSYMTYYHDTGRWLCTMFPCLHEMSSIEVAAHRMGQSAMRPHPLKGQLDQLSAPKLSFNEAMKKLKIAVDTDTSFSCNVENRKNFSTESGKKVPLETQPQPTCYHCGESLDTGKEWEIANSNKWLHQDCWLEMIAYLSQACKVAKMKAKEWNDGQENPEGI